MELVESLELGMLGVGERVRVRVGVRVREERLLSVMRMRMRLLSSVMRSMLGARVQVVRMRARCRRGRAGATIADGA